MASHVEIWHSTDLQHRRRTADGAERADLAGGRLLLSQLPISYTFDDSSFTGNIMSDPEIIMSPLCREIIEDGTKIQVDIYHGENEAGWILEVIDEENASTIWDEPFDTDQEALDTVIKVIELDGIRSFLDGEYEVMQ
jgi:hypothetical protein